MTFNKGRVSALERLQGLYYQQRKEESGSDIEFQISDSFAAQAKVRMVTRTEDISKTRGVSGVGLNLYPTFHVGMNARPLFLVG